MRDDMIDSMKYIMMSTPRKSGKSLFFDVKKQPYTLDWISCKRVNYESKTHRKIMNKIRTKVFTYKMLTRIEEQYLNREIIKLINNHAKKSITSWNIKLYDMFKNDDLNIYTNSDAYKNYFKAKSLIEKDDECEHIWIKNEVKRIIEESILKDSEQTCHRLFESKRYNIDFWIDDNRIILSDKKENKDYTKTFDFSEIYS